MKTKKNGMSFFILLVFVILFSADGLFSQIKKISHPDVHSEGTFYTDDNGNLYSDAIVVKFKDFVFDLPKGIRYATRDAIRPNYPAVLQLVESFEQKFGAVTLIKQIPGAVWGNVTRLHRVTKQPVQIEDLSQLYTFRFSNPIPLDSTLEVLRQLPSVEYVHQPVSIIYYDSPNDPKFQDGSQWNLDVIDAVNAWDITHGSSTIKIAIVDEGTKQDHEDLQSKIVGGDAVEGTHGTWVAGVAGAITNNNKGVASLGWDISLLTYGEGGFGIGSESFIAQKINDAVTDGAHIINMSFGTLRWATIEDMPVSCPDPERWVDPNRSPRAVMTENFSSVSSAISNAITQGVICIASAGNISKNQELDIPSDCDPTPVPFNTWPAQYTDVIAVSGTELISGSEQFKDTWNYGSFVDFSGPGVNIWTTDIGGNYSSVNGTSFSAPLVSALAGLIKSLDATLYDRTKIETILTNTAEKIDASRYPYDSNGWNNRLGYGRINAYQALLLAHAYQNKSMSSEATAKNNERRVVRDNTGKYHLVFESGITSGGEVLSEIFYRNSTDGMSWSTPYVLASTPLASDPLPVISASIVTNYSLSVVFKNGSPAGLKSYYTINTNPASGNWTSVDIPGTSAIHESPSLASAKHYFGGDATYGVAYEGTDGKIYHSYREAPVGAWNSTPIDLSAIVPGSRMWYETVV